MKMVKIYLTNASCKFGEHLGTLGSSSVSKFTSNFAHYSGPRSSTAINQIYAPPRRYVLPYCLGNETSHSRQYYASKDDHKFDPYPYHENRGSRCSAGYARIQIVILIKIDKDSIFACSILACAMLLLLPRDWSNLYSTVSYIYQEDFR